MMSDKLIKFKEALHKGMITNFENDGHLVSVLFFLEDNMPHMTEIPPEFINLHEGRIILADMIKRLCMRPNVIAAGIISEATGVKINADSELAKLLLNGNIDYSELKNKEDVIVMIFSTPEGDDITVYTVDTENKAVLEEITGENAQRYDGMFSHFFTWNTN